VVNSKNVVTGYGSATFGGRAYVTSVSGPGCASCGGRNNSSFGYDGSGNRITSTDAAGTTTSYQYDGNSNVTSSSTPLGNSAVTWSYMYNNFSEVLSATDPMGNTTTNTYDPNGNLLSVTSPAPAVGVPASLTTFGYNNLGELISVTDPLKNVTKMAYTPAGLIQTITDAQNNTTTHAYDPRGNRLSVTDAAGNTTHFAFDRGCIDVVHAEVEGTFNEGHRDVEVVRLFERRLAPQAEDAHLVTRLAQIAGRHRRLCIGISGERRKRSGWWKCQHRTIS